MYKGFTLLESIFVLLIIALLVVMGVPSFNRLIQRERTQSVVNQLVLASRFTRSHALLSSRILTLCPSVNGQYCSSHWLGNLLCFVDRNQDGSRQPTEPRLRVFHAMAKRSYYYKGRLISRASISWDASGETNNNGSFYLESDGKAHKVVVISAVGRIRKN